MSKNSDPGHTLHRPISLGRPSVGQGGFDLPGPLLSTFEQAGGTPGSQPDNRMIKPARVKKHAAPCRFGSSSHYQKNQFPGRYRFHSETDFPRGRRNFIRAQWIVSPGVMDKLRTAPFLFWTPWPLLRPIATSSEIRSVGLLLIHHQYNRTKDHSSFLEVQGIT